MTIIKRMYHLGLGLALLWSSHSSADQMLNGVASYSKLGKERFLAGLYLEQSSADAAAILAAGGAQKMEMRITARRLSARSLTKLWVESMAINNSAEVLQNQADGMVAFAKLLKRSLVAGDQLSIHRRGDGHTYLALNGRQLGTIEQAGFFRALLRSWLGQVPFSSSFKAQLLVAGDITGPLLTRYRASAPSPERLAQLAQAEATAVTTRPTSAETSAPAAASSEAPSNNNLAASPPASAAPKPEPAAPSPLPAPSPAPAPEAAAQAQASPEPSPASTTQAPAQAALEAPTEAALQVASLGPAILDVEALEQEELDDGAEELTAEALINRQLYHSKLVKWTYRHVKYPKRAISRGQQGSVQLELVIDRNGKLQQLAINEPSNYPLLNKAARAAIEKAAPFPPMPETMSEQSFSFALPIVFRLPD